MSAGSISGYMVVTASSRFTSRMELMLLASTTTSTSTEEFPRITEVVYFPGTKRSLPASPSSGVWLFPGRNMMMRSRRKRIPNSGIYQFFQMQYHNSGL